MEPLAADNTSEIPQSPGTEPTLAEKLSEETAPVTEGTPTEICDYCLSLNLPGLLYSFNTKGGMPPAPWSATSPPVAKVGFQYRFPDPVCTLCQIVSASRIDKTDLTADDQGDEIVAVSTNSRDLAHYGLPLDLEGVLGLFMYSTGGSHMIFIRVRDHVESEGFAAVFASSAQPTLRLPRSIPRMIEPHTAKSWLQHCLDSHREECSMRLLPVNGVRVIDCTTFTVGPRAIDSSYVALSYVWGESEDALRTKHVMQGNKLISDKLPALIQDSIKVTKMLGYQYIWIDKYCINQDRPDLKHDQIRQMDAIYRNAILTIICTARGDQNRGLPGVSILSRPQCPLVNFEDVTVMWTPKRPQQAIAQSHWSTRGWTFQEAYLSRRRLVFTDDQMYFECGSMHRCESIDNSLDEEDIGGGLSTHNKLRERIFKRYPEDTYRAYLSTVRDYTARNLRFDDDSINAFRGILREFSRRSEPFGNVWGLCYPLHDTESEKQFAYSLTWKHAMYGKPLRRRAQFPSWTWVGWVGTAVYQFNDFHLNIPRKPSEIQFFSNLRSLRFTGSGRNSVHLKDVAGDDSFTTLQVNAAKIMMRGSRHVESSIDPNSCSWFMDVDSLEISFASKRATRDQPHVHLSWSADVPTFSAFYAEYTDTKRWNCISIGRVSGGSFIMVLEAVPGTEHWQRVGMFSLFSTDLKLEQHLEEDMYHTYNII